MWIVGGRTGFLRGQLEGRDGKVYVQSTSLCKLTSNLVALNYRVVALKLKSNLPLLVICGSIKL